MLPPEDKTTPTPEEILAAVTAAPPVEGSQVPTPEPEAAPPTPEQPTQEPVMPPPRQMTAQDSLRASYIQARTLAVDSINGQTHLSEEDRQARINAWDQRNEPQVREQLRNLDIKDAVDECESRLRAVGVEMLLISGIDVNDSNYIMRVCKRERPYGPIMVRGIGQWIKEQCDALADE